MAKKIIDLFAGCGGMSLGFQNAGFEIISAYDNWQPAIDIYSANFNHPIIKKDLSKEDITGEIINSNPDMIIGRPPCQDFSIAGKRNFQGTRANLTIVFSNIIKTVKPRWFVMENVYNIEKSPIFNEAIQILKDAGYGLTSHIWDASYMGVPQMRRRYFVIGKFNAEDNFILDKIKSNLSKERMTLRNYLKNTSLELDTDYYYMHPRSYARRAIFSVDEPSATIRGVNRPIPIGYKFHNADKIKDLEKVRQLTYKERSYIQTFPYDFIFEGAKTDVEQAIGNAVPVKMAEFIANVIKSYMNEYD